jgi:alkylated DNA repair protein (DNA oxidative demethylase)
MIEVCYTLTIAEQHTILEACRAVVADAPLFQKTMPTGAKFQYRCTSAGQYGWVSDRKGYRYTDLHPLTDQHFPPMPQLFHDIAVRAASFYDLTIRPESALINWYDAKGKLGLHQDKTEISRAPVVSISIGDDCVFTVGGTTRTDPKYDIILHSGDVLVMGEEDRLAFHGVKKILPHTAPAELDLKQAGRVNITIRQVYP